MVLYLIPIILLSSLIFYYTRLTTRRTPKGLIEAPGPKGLPLLGNTHQLTTHPHRQIQAWARQFGEVYKIRLGWNDWYMLCSPSSVREIIDRQSVNSSSRAPMPVANEALSGGMRFLFMEYGEKWRRLRGVSHRWLTPKASATFMPSQEFEGKMLLEEVLKGSEGEGEDGNRERGNEKAYQAVRRYTVSVIMTSTYGKRIPEWECEEVREIYGIMNDFSRVAAPGAYLADTIPPLGRLLPVRLQWWRSALKPLFDRQAKLWMRLWNSLKIQMETDHAPECFVKQVISSDYASHGVSELQAAFLAGSLIEAGSETTSAAINTALLYLSAHPSVLQKAYTELSTVVPESRSPSFADEDKLPYIRAIVKETLRIRPVTNIGTPHYTTAPIVYKNIFIPPGSIVAIQQYAIHYLPSLFPSPSTFNPDRYLAFPEKAGFYAAGGAEKRDQWSFGGGRRVCSGLHLAENSMFIVLAKMIWAFDIGPPVDEKGREVEMNLSDEAFEPGGNTVPKPFRARFVVRGEEVRRTILREAEEARRDGYVLRGEKVTEEGVES